MGLDLTTGWEFDVERGPHCLFVRLRAPENVFDEDPGLGQRIWNAVEKSLCRRVVVEMDELSIVPSYLLGQLIQLQKRLFSSGGLMRICGLSPQCESALRLHRLGELLYPYPDRHSAVMGDRVAKPR